MKLIKSAPQQERARTQGSLFKSQNSSYSINTSCENDREDYVVHINLESINSKNHVKQKVSERYLKYFRQKLNIKTKTKILPPSQDYLYKLTTKQLDNLIMMQRNRFPTCELKIDLQERQEPTVKHNKVYRCSFLSRLNKFVRKNNHLYEKDNLISYHFKKNYKKASQPESDLPEVQYLEHDDLQSFSVRGKSLRKAKNDNRKREYWFCGMSTSLIESDVHKQQPVFRGMDLQRKVFRSSRSQFRSTYQ